MKFHSTFFSIATILVAALSLATATTFTACGNDNTAGTDEQQNSITAKLDSALTEWLAGDTLTATETSNSPCTDCSHDIIHHDSASTQAPKIQAGNGFLYHVNSESFESIVCENDSNWFVYSINVGDSLIQKNPTLPDTLNAEGFESECASNGGKFETDSIVVRGQHSHTCSLETTTQLTDPENKQYVDPNWKRYVKLIVGICRE